MAAYYCTSPRHKLMGAPKLTCLPDGAWDDRPPMCRLMDVKPARKPSIGRPNLEDDDEDELELPLPGGREPDFIRPAPGFPRLRNPGKSGEMPFFEKPGREPIGRLTY